jgi:hypothetical protein
MVYSRSMSMSHGSSAEELSVEMGSGGYAALWNAFTSPPLFRRRISGTVRRNFDRNKGIVSAGFGLRWPRAKFVVGVKRITLLLCFVRYFGGG